jgi:hypothetical protein
LGYARQEPAISQMQHWSTLVLLANLPRIFAHCCLAASFLPGMCRLLGALLLHVLSFAPACPAVGAIASALVSSSLKCVCVVSQFSMYFHSQYYRLWSSVLGDSDGPEQNFPTNVTNELKTGISP